MKQKILWNISHGLAAGALILGVFDGQAATVTIDAVYFAQAHVQKPTQSYFRLVANRNTLLKVHVVSPETPAAPLVTALLSLGGQNTNLTLTGPAVLPASIPDGPGVVQHSYSNSFTALIPKAWVKSGLSLTVSAGTNQVVVTNLAIGAPTKLIMNMFDVQYFADTSGDYPAGWQQEIEAKWPIAEYEVRRLGHVVFPELVIPPRAGVPAARVKSKADYTAQTGLAFDGEQGAALAWNGALKAAAGKSGRISYYYINIYGVAAGGQAGGFGGVGSGTSLGIFHHESGHALSLPHWGDSTSYPYKGDMYGITAPAIYNATHAGPTWAFDLRTLSFIPCTAQSNNVSGHPAGTYKADPMQGGGTGWQEPGYLLNHFSDYSANQARNYLEGHVLVWNTNLGQYASWNQAANGYTTTVVNNGVSYPVVRDTSVISILASVSGANTNINMVYPPIGPYTTGLIKLFDPTVASDRTEAASIFAPAGGCDVCVRLTQGGVQKTYMLAASWDPSADPLAGGSLQTAAINVPASNGVVTKVELLLTPDAQVNGLPANPQVLYTWPASLIAVPANLTATATNSLVRLAWNAASGLTGYKVKRSLVSGGSYTQIGATSATSYNDTLVTNGMTYYYVVSGTNSLGEGANSLEASATPVPPSANATLANLVPSAGTLTPVFASGTFNYAATVANVISNITVTPTAAGAGATIRVNGNPVVSGTASPTLSLSVGTNVIATVVVSPDTTLTNTYTLAMIRAAAVLGTSWWDGGTADIGTTGNGAAQGGNGTWNTTLLNWDQGGGLAHVPWNNTNNDTAIFGGTAGTVTLGTGIAVGGLSFDTSGYLITNGNLSFGTAGAIAVNGTTATISSPFTNSPAVAKTGAGTLIFSGANSFEGGMSVNAGTVRFDSIGAVGNDARSVTAANSATLAFNFGLSNAVLQRLAETANAFNLHMLAPASSTNLDLSSSNGAALPNVTLWGQPNATYAGILTPGGNIVRLGNLSTASMFANANIFTVSGVLNGGDDSVVIVGGSSQPVYLTGNNNYGGNTIVSDGAAVGFDTANVSGLGLGSIVVGANTSVLRRGGNLDNAFLQRLAETTNTLTIYANNAGSGNPLDLSGTNGGRYLPKASLATWDNVGTVSFAFTGTITPADNTYRFGGPKAGNNINLNNANSLTGARSLVVLGGTLKINSSNNFSGSTLLSAGTLYLTSNLGVQNSTIDTSGAGVMNVTGATSPVFGGLKGSKNINALITTGYGSVTKLTLNPEAGVTNSYSGILLDGAAGMSLTKSGPGTQIFTGINTCSGTTEVNGGKLLVNSPGSLAAASAVLVNTNGTLGGNGTINGSVTVADGGTLSPGASIGTMTIGGGLDISAQAAGDTGKLSFELDSTNAHDQIVVAGALTLGAGVLGFSDFEFINLGGLQNGTYKLITSGSLSGTLNSENATGDLVDGYGTIQISGTNLVLLVTGIGGSPASSNALLNSLVLNPAGALTPAFNSNVVNYTASEAYGVAPTVTVVNADLTATNHLIYNGTTNLLASGAPSSPLPLTLGMTNPVRVRVTAQDGVTVNTYAVNVTLQPNLAPPELTSLVSGTTLTLSWPADRLGYTLQIKTNSLNQGLSGGTWYPVSGSSSVTSTNLAMDKNSGTVFYRLMYP